MHIFFGTGVHICESLEVFWEKCGQVPKFGILQGNSNARFDLKKTHTTLLGEVHLKLAISHSFVLTLRLAERLHVVSGQTRCDSNLNNG